MEGLLLLTVLTERHDAVELLVVLTAAAAAELVHLVLRDTHTHRDTDEIPLHVWFSSEDCSRCIM